MNTLFHYLQINYTPKINTLLSWSFFRLCPGVGEFDFEFCPFLGAFEYYFSHGGWEFQQQKLQKFKLPAGLPRGDVDVSI